MTHLRRSPALLVLLFGLVTMTVLVIRGLNFGPLHTDIEVFLVWIDAYGIRGYIDHYLEFNQRHILAAPRNALVYWAFRDSMLPYHLIFQASRVLEGVFMAGIVHQLTRRRLLAVSAGLALSLTPIRLGALYQTISWGIEATLVMLLASTYFYLLSLQSEQPKTRWSLYGASFLCYAVSVFTYESGIPWAGVTALAGWFMLTGIPWQKRAKRIVLESLPFILTGVSVIILVVFVFDPWNDLAPNATDSLPVRVVNLMGSAVTFPDLYLDRLGVALNDGYGVWMLVGVLILGAVSLGVGGRWLQDTARQNDESFLYDFAKLMLLGIAMLFSSILVGASNPDMRFAYQDRITFGRSAGISLLYVTLIFGAARVLNRGLHVRVLAWQTLAMLLTGLILIGPGFTWVIIYREEAQATYEEIDTIAEAVLDVRCLFYRPLHMVIVTEPDWVGSRFPDAADLVIRQTQRALTAAQGDVTIDILRTGNEGYEDDYLPPAGTCELNFPSGLCLEENGVRSSRWAIVPWVPNEDIVIVKYANDGTMSLLPEITVADLGTYNIATAGPAVLKTDPERLLLPFDQMPVPLSGHCPGQ